MVIACYHCSNVQDTTFGNPLLAPRTAAKVTPVTLLPGCCCQGDTAARMTLLPKRAVSR